MVIRHHHHNDDGDGDGDGSGGDNGDDIMDLRSSSTFKCSANAIFYSDSLPKISPFFMLYDAGGARWYWAVTVCTR